MKPSANFLQDCMHWLTEISGFTVRINAMQGRLQNARSTFTNDIEKHTLLQRIQVTLSKFADTERRIIHTIKKQLTYPYIAPTEIKLAVENEDELFDEMKDNYNLFIELQRSFNYSLKDAAPKEASKIIEMPRLNKLQPEKKLGLLLRRNIS